MSHQLQEKYQIFYWQSKMNFLKSPLYFALILTFISNVCWSQHLILKGSVKSINNETLVYVNIGIKNKNIGTISDEYGNFSLRTC